MKISLIFFILSFSSVIFSNELKWNCENLKLKFVENPAEKGSEFSASGCWQESTYFLISNDCQKAPKDCLLKGEKKEIKHPGGGIGSPAFSQCYNVGGRPRFLQIKIKDKWENTSTCFFGSENSFMDFDTILKNKSK